MTDFNLDEHDARLAETAGALLKEFIRAARIHHTDDQETLAELAALVSCRLTITAVGPALQIQLVGPVEGGTRRFYGATFAERDEAGGPLQ